MCKGFTLLEILIAVFVFSILSVLLGTTLHVVLDHQARAEQNADSFETLQIAMLLLSRDLEQVINRPVMNNEDKQEAAFIGTTQMMTFTHAGLSNPLDQLPRSTLQRTRYKVVQGDLIRETWPVLDLSPTTKPNQRIILKNVTNFSITYFDANNKPKKQWPIQDQPELIFPHVVRISFIVQHWGKMEQTYVL